MEHMKTPMQSAIDDDSNVPLKWVFALLAGCSVFIGTAVSAGIYFGARDAKAEGLVERVTKLEASVDAMSLVDRRLARIEGALGVKVPAEDRLPASAKYGQ